MREHPRQRLFATALENLMPSIRSWTVAAAVGAASLASPAFAQLWDNGAQGNGVLITHPNGMTGAAAGAHRSAISPTPATLFGIGAAQPSIRVADNFTVTGPGWDITSFQFFGYTTGAAAPGVSAVSIRIWDGAPGELGSTIIFGDTSTNFLSSGGWATGPGGLAIYRTTSTDTAGTTRRLQQATADVNLTLGAGTYWVDFSFAGLSFIPSLGVTAGAPPVGTVLQSLDGGLTYVPGLDAGLGQQVEVPFIIQGAIVPEPGTWALMLAGGLAVAGMVRRRRQD
jgi:hypothetical protein